MHPILFEIGPLTIRSYGVFVALAFFTAFFLLYKEAKRKAFYPDKILDMELVILIFGVLGARLLHVSVNAGYYRGHLLETVMLWRGGLAIYGGLLFGVAFGWIFILKNKMPLFKTGDFFAPYIALGQSIGRIGCFLNGCCFGRFLNGYYSGYRHPTQLYHSSALIGIFVILKLAEKMKLREGTLFYLYLLLYVTQRFFIDFLRDDTPRYIYNLTVSQLISIAVFAVVIFVLFLANTKKSGMLIK